MVGRIIAGWILVFLVYVVTLFVACQSYMALYHLPIDHKWDQSGLYIGSWLVIVPYVVAGFYARASLVKPLTGAFWVSLVPIVMEKLLIFGIGYLFVVGEPLYEMRDVMGFIRGEAAPYYTPLYIGIGGAVSLVLALAISRVPRINFQK
ncbi:MAG TPA: hypothetical protein VFV52_16865 [Bacilli bacterium]|nr:hypothetical protein [Bacilli bacterium]